MDALPPSLPPPTPVTAQCLWEAAIKERLPVEILVAVLHVERGKPGMRKKNTNESEDLGEFQVNSIHASGDHVVKHYLANHGCYNAAAAAYRLRSEIDRTKDFWRGVGNYHSRTPELHQRYMQRIVRALRETSVYSTRMRQVFQQPMTAYGGR